MVPESVSVYVGSVLVSCAQLGMEKANTTNPSALNIAFNLFMYLSFEVRRKQSATLRKIERGAIASACVINLEILPTCGRADCSAPPGRT
jgi:hypothetical protein